MSADVRARRVLTYIGKRESTEGQLIGFWLDDDGVEHGYRKLATEAALGARYEVAFGEGGAVFVSGEEGPRYLDRLPVDDERVVAWSAQDRVARAQHEQARRAKSEGKAEAFEALCRPLQELYARERTTTGRTALLAAFIAQVTRPLSRPAGAGAH